MAGQENQQYTVLYGRLSQEDERAGESNSIQHQRSHRRKACACAVFEQKEKRQAEQESRRKTYNLPFGKVESYFCLDFG